MAKVEYTGKRRVKGDLNKVKALINKGLSSTELGAIVGVSQRTMYRYLDAIEAEKHLVSRADTVHLDDLKLLNLKARMALAEKINFNKLNNIELIALLDRTFQQIQLLTGGATSINVLASLIMDADADGKQALKHVTLEAEVVDK